MGVPKFFRYMSERYPCLSEFVKEYQIPEFDNLYLDMNGIIHMCSHPDDNNPHFRITEEKLFADIFHYIEVLFRMIRPQKVFFMAVDGVAPRAKMNQQRGRRFRSAKDADKLEADALKKGEKLPDVARFDSNCITPGTDFMAKLHAQLQYFVVKKVSSDRLWQRCRVVLSGHETPGEGEHKIMDFIRYERAQPGYDPNTRHCLYGLDADLIMLGLCTHDPHFALLREEVKFGRKSTKRNYVPEEIRFYLLHLSLMREYLELEFGPVKEKLAKNGALKFDIECIIDDWILMGFLVGNDFIPNLPDLHIAHGALPVLYGVYMEVLPTLDGYINEGGTLNLKRFQTFMTKLAELDIKNFEDKRADLQYMSAKSGRKIRAHAPNVDYKNKSAGDEIDFQGMDPALAALIQQTDDLDIISDGDDDADESTSTDDDFTTDFKSYKDEYYRNKLEYHKVTREVMREQAEGYVRAIQWNLNYYYNGVSSWSWFYPHHYAPYISDIKGFENLKIDFDLGKPFQPFEQLLAVLPTASKSLLPTAYHNLMCDETSIIKEYYPDEFLTDLNGKRQEWEAVVLVPFIDENTLLGAMRPCNEQLSPDERKRNTHGPMLIYDYVSDDLGAYEAPNYFPKINESHARCERKFFEDIRVAKDKLIKGAYPGAKFDVFYPGFPTLKHLEYCGVLKAAKVKVFEQPSRGENMILKVLNREEERNELPKELLGKVVWVGWPHLVEARVIGVSNSTTKLLYKENGAIEAESRTGKSFDHEKEGVTSYYMSRWGVDFGKTEVLVHVQMMEGRKYVYTLNGRLNLEKQFSIAISYYPLQSVVVDIVAYDATVAPYRDIKDLFSVGSTCFSLSHPYYGSKGTILDSTEALKNEQLSVLLEVHEEPNLDVFHDMANEMSNNYQKANVCASYLSMSPQTFSRVTGSLFLSVPDSQKSINVGLDLKFNKKNQETPGYTKRMYETWCYTQKAVDLVREYAEKFFEVFDFLSKSRFDDEMSVTKIFGTEMWQERLKELQLWIRGLPTHNIERRVCGSDVLEPETIEQLEKTIDQFLVTEKPKQITLSIKPKNLYKPEMQMGNLKPDKDVENYVFDRIVNIRNTCTVPLGLKGTIIAIHKPSNSEEGIDEEVYDILFDRRFDGGMTLNCSESRAFRLQKVAFINLSHGTRKMELQTGKPGNLRARMKEQQVGHNFRTNTFDNNEHGKNSAFVSVNKNNFMRRNPQSQANLINNSRQTQPPANTMNRTANSNNFMPKFPVVLARNAKESQPEKRVATSTNPFLEAASSAIPEKPAPAQELEDCSSMFLKQMLKIESTNGNANANTSTNTPSSNIKATPTTKLLYAYQSRGWGAPKFVYGAMEGNKYRARLHMPNGHTVTGKCEDSKEAASESVAEIALEMLRNAVNPPQQQMPRNFPVPPQNWMHRAPMPATRTQVFTNSSYQMVPQLPPRAVMHQMGGQPLFQHTSGGLPKPQPQTNEMGGKGESRNFIPLQAITKRPVVKGNVGNAGVNNTRDQKPVLNESNSANIHQEAGGSRAKTDKKSRRRPRIAANFSKNY